jgi:O-antigen/teichoic acid export membrane protein
LAGSVPDEVITVNGGEHADAKTELRRSFSLRVLAASLGAIATFLLTVIVVRTLDAPDSAVFFAILAALSIGSIVGRLGLGPNVVRLIPAESDRQKRRVIAGTHLKATMLLTAPTAPVVALFASIGLIGHGNFLPVFILTSSIIMIETVRMMLSDIFAGLGRVAASVATMHYLRSIMVVPVVGVVAITFERPTLVTLLATYAAVSAVQLVVALWLGRKEMSLAGSQGTGALRAAFSAGTRLFSLDVASFTMVAGSIWIANAVFTPDAATRYSAAAAIAMQVTVLESLAAWAVTAPAARLWAAERRQEVVRLLSNLATVNTAVVVVVVGALAMVGGTALEIAYGPSMRSAAVVLVILACGGIFQAAFGVSIAMLIISGHINEVSRTALIVVAVELPAAIAAAHFGGAEALASVSSAGVTLLAASEWLTARKCLDEAPRPHLNVVRAVREIVWSCRTEADGVS